MGHVTWGIIIASGKDEQLTAEADTGFLSLGSQPVLVYSLLAFEQCADVEGVVVVVHKERMEGLVGMVNMFGLRKVKKIVAGTAARRTSLQNGMKVLPDDVTVITIHEGSRPCITPELIGETIKCAKRYGSGVAAFRLAEPACQVEKGQKASEMLGSNRIWAIQKPQSYKRDVLEAALEAAGKQGGTVDDESSMLALTKKAVQLVPSTATNIRIRSVDDLTLALALTGQPPSSS